MVGFPYDLRLFFSVCILPFFALLFHVFVQGPSLIPFIFSACLVWPVRLPMILSYVCMYVCLYTSGFYLFLLEACVRSCAVAAREERRDTKAGYLIPGTRL